MKAETWEKLNGQCFGDDPYPERDMELQVPEWMCSRSNSVPDVPVSAYCGQAAGRVKRQVHLAEKHRRDSVNAVFWILVAFALLVLAVNLPEVIL